MSIYATIYLLGEHSEPEDLGPPIVYHHSGHRPDMADREGHVEIAGIPGHLCDEDDDAWCPYLRLGVSDETVVLDLEQADELLATLKAWREQVVSGAVFDRG